MTAPVTDLRRARILKSIFDDLERDIAVAVSEWAWPRNVFTTEVERRVRDAIEAMPSDSRWPESAA